jgi:hypothetical protein
VSMWDGGVMDGVFYERGRANRAEEKLEALRLELDKLRKELEETKRELNIVRSGGFK